jgi:hypothetical protein
MNMEQIWYNDIISFFDVKNIMNILPNANNNMETKLNMLLRFSMLISLFLYGLNNNYKIFYFPIIISITTIIVMNYYEENNTDDETYTNFEDGRNDGKKHNMKCTKPTKQNPFMNVLMNEYSENPIREEACDVDKVHKYVDKYFENNLYRSVDDMYNRDSSTRQYYTMPNTKIPNDQEGFANWLYGIEGKTCKEGNGMKCKYF